MKKTKVTMNKPVYLRMKVLHISKAEIYEFWYDWYDKNMEIEQIMLHGH